EVSLRDRLADKQVEIGFSFAGGGVELIDRSERLTTGPLVGSGPLRFCATDPSRKLRSDCLAVHRVVTKITNGAAGSEIKHTAGRIRHRRSKLGEKFMLRH